MSPGALSYIARHARGPLMRSQPDHRLVVLAQSGSEPAFEALVARYREPLLRYCRRLLSGDRAEDALQQTFVNAHAAIVAGRAGDDLRAWLYRIAHNVAIDQLRQRQRPDEQLSEDLPGGDLPEDIFSRRERFAGVLAALDDLPVRQRDALLLRELEGRSYDEIAYAMGVGDGAVRQLLNRARHTMRQAAAALVPPVLLRWTPDHVARTAEVAGGAGVTTVAAKTWLGGLIAAASLGGAVAVPIVSDSGAGKGRPAPAEAHELPKGPAKSSPAEPAAPAAVVHASAPAGQDQRSEAPRKAADKAERHSSSTNPDADRHDRVLSVPPGDDKHDDDDGADERDEPADEGTHGRDDNRDESSQPPEDQGDGRDDAGNTGGEDPPEIELEDHEDPPEAAAVDEPGED